MPVFDIAECAAHFAHLIGRRFSVVTTLARSIAPIEDRLKLAGLDAHCVSVRACGVGTAEVDADPAAAVAAIVDEAIRAVNEDGADVICLGCAGMAGVTAAITEKPGVPAVDGVAAAVALAQAVVGIGAVHQQGRGVTRRDQTTRAVTGRYRKRWGWDRDAPDRGRRRSGVTCPRRQRRRRQRRIVRVQGTPHRPVGTRIRARHVRPCVARSSTAGRRDGMPGRTAIGRSSGLASPAGCTRSTSTPASSPAINQPAAGSTDACSNRDATRPTPDVDVGAARRIDCAETGFAQPAGCRQPASLESSALAAGIRRGSGPAAGIRRRHPRSGAVGGRDRRGVRCRVAVAASNGAATASIPHASALIEPGRPRNMGDGWETRRRRDIGPDTHDAVMISFAVPADLRRLEIDTTCFVFNATPRGGGSRHPGTGPTGNTAGRCCRSTKLCCHEQRWSPTPGRYLSWTLPASPRCVSRHTPMAGSPGYVRFGTPTEDGLTLLQQRWEESA